MLGLAHTTFSIFNGTTTGEAGDEVDDNTTPAASGVPGSIGRKKAPLVFNEASYTPRTVNWYTVRLPRRYAPQVLPTSRLKDEKSGAFYLVDYPTAEPGVGPLSDLRVDVKKIN